MEKFDQAFEYLEKNFKQTSNGKLFRLANTAFEKGGRGAITMLYTNVSDVYDATGMAPAQFLPKEIVKAEDGDDVAKACDAYNPHSQFVVSVSIGQDNDITKPVVRKTFTIKYIGQKGEDMLAKLTMSLEEMDTRLIGKKSWPCDFCGQRRKLENLVRDPVVKKLVYCNAKCYEGHYTQGGQELILWYAENYKKYAKETEVASTKATITNAVDLKWND